MNPIVVDSLWPDDGKSLTLFRALESAGQKTHATELKRAAQSLATAQSMLGQPIIAVTGQLNAGKSSVVASFLSATGRSRVPRGEASATGTHRFVYWVPSAWLEEPAKKRTLLDLLDTAHSGGVEFLDDDPTRAAQQYASGRDHLEHLAIPLVAGDPALNDIEAALLDCPDVQTHDTDTANETANPRLDFLAAAARVCSAFLVVWRRDAIRDRLLESMLATLRERMASAPLFLLINMIRPEEDQPNKTLDDTDVTRLLESFQISSANIFGAFDFAIEGREGRIGWRDLTPDYLVERFATDYDADSSELPQFYPLAAGTRTKSDLLSLPGSLEIADLQQTKIDDHRTELEKLITQAKSTLREWLRVSTTKVASTHAGLLEFCVAMMTDRATGEPLQIPSSQFAAALNESFIRTAPLPLRLSLKLARPFDRALSQGRSLISKLSLKGKLSDIEGKVRDHLHFGSLKIANSDSLAREMHAQRWCPAEISEQQLLEAWRTIIKNFSENPIEEFDLESLDAMSATMWKGFGGWKKFTIGSRAILGALGSAAALGGIVTAAVDGGATIYAATAISSFIHGGTALAVAIGGTAAAWVGFRKELIDKNTLPYLSRLFAFSCDAFGLPRRIDDKTPMIPFADAQGKKSTFPLPSSDELAISPTVTPLIDARLWRPCDALSSLSADDFTR